MLTAQQKRDRVFEAIDTLIYRVYNTWLNGNLSEARLQFNKIPPERRAYAAWSMCGYHMSQPGRPAMIELEAFFKGVTS